MISSPIIIAAGGTGGHIFPAQAFAEALLKRNQPVVFITDARGKSFGESLKEVPVELLAITPPRAGVLSKLRAALTILFSFAQSYFLLRRYRPSIVVGFGGYPSFPTVWMAQRIGIPTILHEQNAVLGRANKWLAKRAELLATSFPVNPLNAANKWIHTGNPVRPAIVALASYPYPPLKKDDPLSILITGGSQGATIFSQVVPAAVSLLSSSSRARLRIVQQARAADIEQVRAAYKDLNFPAEIESFFQDMPRRLVACHLMICRSGASTMAELAVTGRPAIFVPYPHSLTDDQLANAQVMAKAGGGWLMPQSEFTPETLAQKLEHFLQNPEILMAAATAARTQAVPDAAERLVNVVMRAF